jgi:hypothetical protein
MLFLHVMKDLTPVIRPNVPYSCPIFTKQGRVVEQSNEVAYREIKFAYYS